MRRKFRMEIKSFEAYFLDDVVRLSLRAWEPVFASLEKVLEPEVYREFYPEGWRASQRKSVEAACRSAEMKVWVAVDDRTTAGFVAVRLDAEAKLGEIYMIAVDPLYQKRGIGSRLTDFAIERMKEAGMTVAMVETGGDPGHAPARRTYERAGFGLLPVARYFKKL